MRTMNWLIPYVQKYFWLLFSLLVALGICCLVYSTGGELLFTFDSYQYWAAAKSFSLTGKFLNAQGMPLAYYPPLFPFVLSFFSSIQYYFICLVLLFILNAYLMVRIILGLEYSKTVALLAVAFYLTHVNVYLIGSFLWSEMLFLSLLFLLFILYKKIKTELNFKYLIVFGLVAMLLCLQRNIGLFILIGWSFIALKDFIRYKNGKLLVAKAVCIIIAITPNCLWNIYHITTHGEHYQLTEIPLFTDIYLNLNLTATYLLKVFAPIDAIHLPAYVLIGLALLLLIVLYRWGNANINIIITSYIVLLSFTAAEHYGIDERFLAVVIPLVIINMAILVSKLQWRGRELIISGILVLLLVYNGYRTAQNVSMWHKRVAQETVVKH